MRRNPRVVARSNRYLPGSVSPVNGVCTAPRLPAIGAGLQCRNRLERIKMNRETESTEATNSKRKVPWLWLTTAVAAAALFALLTFPDTPTLSAQSSDVVVYKTATCGCCGKWVDHLRDAGLSVDVVNVKDTHPTQTRMGVPRHMGSCHTAVAGDYWVEGHVPADLVIGLITDKPAGIKGIAVPGMVAGSPGMEGPNPVVYDILAYGTDGNTTVYATRQGLSH
jgi:hypothetical protein